MTETMPAKLGVEAGLNLTSIQREAPRIGFISIKLKVYFGFMPILRYMYSTQDVNSAISVVRVYCTHTVELVCPKGIRCFT